jgi:F0F1-type ATP synthase assembly protein I
MVIGLVVDDLAGSSPVGVLVGIAVGVAVGIVGFWLRVRNALRD